MSLTDTIGSVARPLRTAAARSSTTHGLVDLADIPIGAWTRLADRTLEPNAFYHPLWARAVSAHARGRTGAKALVTWDGPQRRRLIGLLPVQSAVRALGLPLPLLVGWQAYGALMTPLLDATAVDQAVHGLLAAAEHGSQALLLPFLAEGTTALAIRGALAERGLRPWLLRSQPRAKLNASGDADAKLQAALGAKKFKELRRQAHRLAEHGEIRFEVATSPMAVNRALDEFLALEARGWKGRRGTALGSDDGDTAFIRRAATALALDRTFEVAILRCGDQAIAAGLLLRQGRRAFFFKIAYDETFARYSPGVQFSLELTRHLIADPRISEVDSIADAYPSMIDHVWRERMPISDMLIPLRHDRLTVAALRGILTVRAEARTRLRPAVEYLREWRARRAASNAA